MLVLVLVVHSQWWRRSVKILLDLECRSSGVLEQATLLYYTLCGVELACLGGEGSLLSVQAVCLERCRARSEDLVLVLVVSRAR